MDYFRQLRVAAFLLSSLLICAAGCPAVFQGAADGTGSDGMEDDEPRCGNGVCDAGENQASCAADCEDVGDDGGRPVPCTIGGDQCAADEVCQDGFCQLAQGPGDGDGEGPACGNGFCEIGETSVDCPADCLKFFPGDAECGNGFCELGESQLLCPTDCEVDLFPGDGVCGNDVCELGETAAACPFDCTDSDLPGGNNCGDGFCNFGETVLTCPLDCLDPFPGPAICGNAICESTENAFNCPLDCD